VYASVRLHASIFVCFYSCMHVSSGIMKYLTISAEYSIFIQKAVCVKWVIICYFGYFSFFKQYNEVPNYSGRALYISYKKRVCVKCEFFN
jgi:hypothetical protein